MKHTASARFSQCFDRLSADLQTLARKNFALLKADPSHPSLHFQPVANGRFYSVRVRLYHRVLGAAVEEGVHWFWIGTHPEYDKLVG